MHESSFVSLHFISFINTDTEILVKTITKILDQILADAFNFLYHSPYQNHFSAVFIF